MKKVLSMLFVLIICFGMCSCAKTTEDVRNDLVRGTWGTQNLTVLGLSEDFYVFFSDGTYKYEKWITWGYGDNIGDTELTYSETGTYLIQDDIIVCYGHSVNGNSRSEIYHTYEWGKLVLSEERYDSKSNSRKMITLDHN